MRYLIGQVMKITNGKADPALVRKILNELIDEQLNQGIILPS